MINKAYYPSLKLIAFFLIAISGFHASSSQGNSPDDPACTSILDFNRFPYEPIGECIGYQEDIQILGSLRTTICCRNVLNVISKTLASKINTTNSDYIFIPQKNWMNCNGPFHRQDSVSPNLCGFDNLYNGSSACSGFELSSIKDDSAYKNALAMCSTFTSASSFNEVCSNCTSAILGAVDRLLGKIKADQNERPICAIAMVISITAAQMRNFSSSVDDFYRCLPALDTFDVGYSKIKHGTIKALFSVLMGVIALTLMIILIMYVTKSRRKSKHHNKPAALQSNKEMKVWSGLYRFSKAEIENAINSSNDKICLGRGSAGQVYKGVLPSGQAVAIKQIHQSCTSDSFQREVEGLSRVRHPNLVFLFGYCIEGGDRYLVYEYCSAGNLAQHLLRKDAVLTWERRVKILRDCALGLRYLHQNTEGCIVHRDIKLTNILLTESLEPKLSDFGLAKMLGMEESKVFTDVRGTIGYMDPEYMITAKLTCASDIYSFGIVILQLLSGQKVFELDRDARDQLTTKAKDVNSGRRPITDFIDQKLDGKVNKADFEAILQIAVLCVLKSSKGRPTMDIIYEEMDKAWKNTVADMKVTTREARSFGAASMSMSFEAIPV